MERVVGFWAITIYAVGDILGAGIYALVGKVVGLAGGGAWFAFILSATVALLTGLTYAEMSSRLPIAAGAVAYSERAFGRRPLSFLVGFFVLVSGISSAATVSLAFSGYLSSFVELPPLPVSVTLLAVMSLISFRGIRESTGVNVVLTAIELFGLLVVLAVGLWVASLAGPADWGARLAPPDEWSPLVGGAALAFYAYIGFEDTVNIAEEVRDPRRVLPRAILIAIVFTGLVYVGVTVAALLAVPQATLAASQAPLLEVLAAAGLPVSPAAFSVIALFAIANTGLLNLVMASRLTYGMAREGLLPARLGLVHPVRRTPWVAVLAAFVLAALLAVSGGVQILAQTTSFLLLCVFTVVHVGLVRLKKIDPRPGADVFLCPNWTPWLGALSCIVMVLQFPAGVYVRGGMILLAGVALFMMIGRARASRRSEQVPSDS